MPHEIKYTPEQVGSLAYIYGYNHAITGCRSIIDVYSNPKIIADYAQGYEDGKGDLEEYKDLYAS